MPSALGDAEGVTGWPAAVAETHVSAVLFLGDRAYKIKKPVKTPFLDYSTREAREHVCHEEVRLNRRLSPDVYLGVADVVGPDGSPCDHLVVMRRLPDDRRLSALVQTGRCTDGHIAAIARTVAAFHEAADRSEAIDRMGSLDAVYRLWTDNLRELRELPAGTVAGDVVDAIDALASMYLAGRAPLFEQRVEGGHIVDGHGDLMADDIFCMDDGPRILDCLEFDPCLRAGDVLLDLAMLVMDLERLGRIDLAALLLSRYRELTGERHPSSLEHHYVAYRAMVRAKVGCLRAGEGGATLAPAQALLDMCARHLHVAETRLVLVGGLPGTGKSTLAAALGDRLRWTVLRSDEIRKENAGLDSRTPAPAPYRKGLYDPAITEETYGTTLQRASIALGLGESVVLDASWTSAAHRARAERVALDAKARLVAFECRLDPGIAAARLQARRGDASDATLEVAAEMAATAVPWTGATTIETADRPERVLGHALAVLGL